MALAAGARIGRYVIDRRLAVGGMAEAYLAHQEGPAGFSKSVVVKLLHEQHANDPAMIELFLREARVGARLNHQNLVQIFDLGDVDGKYFIAMEYVDGLTLLQLTKRCWGLDQGIPMEIAVRIVAAAAHGLHYAHTLRAPDGSHAGVVHRDISPDNIMIARDGAVKVLDFGVAKLFGSESSRSGEIKGKVPFMSPEQLDPNKEVDARTDLWALGVTLYWCLVGFRPFSGATDIHIVRAILDLQPVPVREHNKAVPAELEAVVMNLLEKDAGARISSANKLAARLLRLVPPSQHNPVARFMERMSHFDDDPPEARPKVRTSVSGTGGLPASPLSGDSTDILARDATADAVAVDAAPAQAAAASTEDVPSTVRLKAGRQAGATSGHARKALVAAGVTAIVVVAAVAMFTRSGGDDLPVIPERIEPAPAPVTSPPEPPPQPLAEAVPPVEPIAALTGEAAIAPLKGAPRAPRTVVVSAPAHVRWLSSTGKVLGQGNNTLTVTENVVVAHDTKRDGRTLVPVAAKIDYAKLPMGSLLTRVLPFATNVKIGGESLGPTPVRTIALVAGSYRVVIEKDGKAVTRTVKVKPGDQTLLTVDLRSAP